MERRTIVAMNNARDVRYKEQVTVVAQLLNCKVIQFSLCIKSTRQ
jgi:hypothetical protein